jgi:hypothetical protein
MPEPNKQEIEARAYKLWGQQANPKIGKLNSGSWQNSSYAMRTNPRQRARRGAGLFRIPRGDRPRRALTRSSRSNAT